MDMDLIDDAACAASDLTARLQADLARALAQLAITEGRALACLAVGDSIPLDVRNARILDQEKVAVLRELLDHVPAVEGGGHAASA